MILPAHRSLLPHRVYLRRVGHARASKRSSVSRPPGH